MKKIISVVGARPNFVKIAPLCRALTKHSDKVAHLICHTGQHFDELMSDIFFEEMELPEPSFFLSVGGGSHATQTANIMLAFEKVLLKELPDLIIVVGDVNSTVACSLVAAKLNIPIAHVEAGLRSFDRSMPEEINRVVTDMLSDYLFVTEQVAIENLKNAGIPSEKIHFVGNVMIDSLIHFLPKAELSTIFEELNITQGEYILATFHRPTNVDDNTQLSKLIAFLNTLANNSTVVFPVHPRTRINLDNNNLIGKLGPGVLLTDPMSYINFLALIKHARLIATDSGGIQEESTYLSIPCITIRESTERPITVTIGTNEIAGADYDQALKLANKILRGGAKDGEIPELWDGHAAERIVKTLMT